MKDKTLDKILSEYSKVFPDFLNEAIEKASKLEHREKNLLIILQGI